MEQIKMNVFDQISPWSSSNLTHRRVLDVLSSSKAGFLKLPQSTGCALVPLRHVLELEQSARDQTIALSSWRCSSRPDVGRSSSRHYSPDLSIR